MDVLNDLALGFSVALRPENLLFALLGVLLGTIIGALPGIGPSAGIAILLPLTFGMDGATALIMLAGIYYGAMYGGTITSVLINVPGESASVMTTLDGYQMARQGRAGAALGIAAIGSFIAGTIGVILMMLFAPLLASYALSFGPPEYFALMLMGMATLAGLSSGSALKALMMAIVGLMLATVGVDIISGQQRFTFGQLELVEGIDFLPVAIGLFGIAELLVMAEETGRVEILKVKIRNVFPTARDWVSSRGAIGRGSLIGFFIGVLPGAGATLASFFSYSVEKRLSKHPEKFGTGVVEGVAGPEAANNSATAGALVPMLTLGIPGSGTTAVLLGALIMYGIRPGPQIFDLRPDVVWGLIASMYVGNVLLVIMNIAFIPAFVAVLRTPRATLVGTIAVLCLIGAYSLQNSLFHVWVMLAAGALGYVMRKLRYPPAPLVLALVLGPMLEQTLRQSMIISQGSIAIFFTRPISAVLMVVAILGLFWPLISRGLRRQMPWQAASAQTPVD